MEVRQELVEKPFFSVCIPQYNRISFLIESCRSLAAQSFRDFEVCISDDCSPENREEELLEFLRQSGLSFVYKRQSTNLRYDANLRASIGLSKGEYCLLMGNDDALASSDTLQMIFDRIERFGPAGVVITNYRELGDGKVMRRIKQTGLLGSGPVAAANNYRNVSFVSGVVLDGARARALTTRKWDGSEMYQMYLTCRILSEGASLVGIDEVAVLKDIQVEGEGVDSYAQKPRLNPCPIVERRHTFHFLGRLVIDAIEPYLSQKVKQDVSEKVLQQLIVFTYPFWIFEFRRIQSWKYAAGVCLGMRPRNILEGVTLSRLRRVRIALLYALVSSVGLVAPVNLFRKLYPQLHALSKSRLGQLLVGARGEQAY